MEYEKIIESLLKKFPQLPPVRHWEKHDMNRYYFNKEENGIDYTFFIDFTDENDPMLRQKHNTVWHPNYPDKQKIKIFLDQYKDVKIESPPKVSSEFYQVNVKKLGEIYYYKIEISGGKIQKIGGKLAYRLRSEFGGHWNFSEYALLSNTFIEESKLNLILEKLWSDESETFNNLTKITYAENEKPPMKALADFAATYLESKNRNSIIKILEKHKKQELTVKITRNFKIRGWDIFNSPAISLSVNSNMVYEKTLDTFMKSLKDQEELLGFEVIDIYLSHRGKITGITGFLKDHRERLLNIKVRELIKRKIQDAPDDEIVFSIDNKYDYVASSLHPIVTTKNAHYFNINSRKLMSSLTLSPEYRIRIEQEIIRLFEEFLLMNYNSETTPELFKGSQDIGFKELVRFGDGTTHNLDEYVIGNMQKHGIFQLTPKFGNNKIIRITLIIATLFGTYNTFWEALKKQLETLYFTPQLARKIIINNVDRLQVEEKIKNIPKDDTDIIVGILPEDPTKDKVYEIFKSSLFSQDFIGSQFVFENTDLKYALANVVLGILAKTENIPYILAEPLNFADFFVGIDISREKKSGLKGTQNYLAMARFYGQDGTLANYEIHEDKIEGETVPKIILDRIFAKSQFQNKTIMIHRDGFFRGSEISDLKEIGNDYNIQFQFVEVIKTNVPRLFGSSNAKYSNPKRNQIFYLSKQEAIIINNKVTGSKTAKPLRVRTLMGNVNLDNAIKSVMSLRLMHFGTTKTPKLPVTISFSDRISGFARRGIRPPHRSGKVSWWY
ncbi:MAG: Piwi domain-containing protein [Promethearchaeota archaeon]